MFTGLVEELGTFAGHDGVRYRFECAQVMRDAAVGDSIAVNGSCLTVVELGTGWWGTDLSAETLARTTLGMLAPGDRVNLERAVRVSDRLGGHVMQGHVDGIGHVVSPAPDLRVRIPSRLARYCVEKGSITVDGVSLTCFDLADDAFSVAVIPHTAAVTTLGGRVAGSAVNIEVDVAAKQVEALLAPWLERIDELGRRFAQLERRVAQLERGHTEAS